MQLTLIGVALASVLSAPAFAANTITFSGEVTDQTCSAVVNGGTDPVVVLDSVPLADLDGAVGKSAGESAFTLTLTGCAAPATAAEHFTTLFQATNATAGGNMTNTAAAGASGVALQLLDGVGGARVRLGGGPVSAGDIVLATGQTSASHDYAVQYISEAATVTPGPVLGSVTYTIRYE